MTLSGMRLVRQVFSELLPPGYTVGPVYMHYEHDHDVEWQVLTFHVNAPDGKPFVLTSQKVPARDDINELARSTARKFIEGLVLTEGSPKNEPPPASN
jgi:hypothetical protein